MIVWRLTEATPAAPPDGNLLDLHECRRIIDGVARLSRPIVVLNGPSLLGRDDLHEIVAYGRESGLKMIIEISPEEVTGELIDRYKGFGPKIFRLVLENHIQEEVETRFRSSEEFLALERAIALLKSKNLELHFSYRITNPDPRRLAFNLDYIFRKDGQGLYCHLQFDRNVKELTYLNDEVSSLDEFITKISDLKFALPNEMYLSPQCVRYVPLPPEERAEFDFSDFKQAGWIHQCLAGKTFAFIDEHGKVYVCSGMCKECGDLRKEKYDFRAVWINSEVMQLLRQRSRSCVQTRLMLKKKRGIQVQLLDEK